MEDHSLQNTFITLLRNLVFSTTKRSGRCNVCKSYDYIMVDDDKIGENPKIFSFGIGKSSYVSGKSG